VKLELQEGSCGLSRKTVLAAGPGTVAEAEKLSDLLRRSTGLPLPVRVRSPSANCIALSLDKALSSRLGREGYLLSVLPDRVTIRAACDTGLFYGTVTLRQLLPPQIYRTSGLAGTLHAAGGNIATDERRSLSQDIVWRMPCVRIEDRPRFAWRGLLLDVARHYMPLDFLRKVVDLLALHKMNVLQLHLTDDQGWRLEIKKRPRLIQIGSIRKESPKKGDPGAGDGMPYGPFFYSQEQMRELVAYARARHVTVVPEIEMPGHFLAALAAYPQYSCTGGPFEVRTRWGIESDILCAGNNEAVAFALEVLDEVVELFPSEFIHIGGDEAPKDRWRNCAKCQARIKAEGLKNEEALQGWFNQRIEEFLVSKGRRLIGWDEILEGGLPPRTAVMSWRGIAGGVVAANAGHDVVMSPTSHCYFDYAQAEGPGEPESIGGFIPLSKVYAFDPVPPDLPAERQRHILGAQGNVWTEFIWTPEQAEYFAFPRATALAEVVWSKAGTKDYSDFLRRLAKHCARLDGLRVNYRPLDVKAEP
jgi:hexosaminidase